MPVRLAALSPAPKNPPNGSRFWPGGIARLVFSRPMDPIGVENALQVTPPVPLQEVWVGTTIYSQPVNDWQPDTTYGVRLARAVADAQGRTLARPISFSFRVHYLGRLGFCRVGGVRNVCEYRGDQARPLTHAAQPVLQYAPSPYVSRLIQTGGGSGAAQAQVWDLSPPGSMLAYTSRDGTGLPHLFVTHLDGTGTQQLTFGTANADSDPFWLMGDISTVGYYQ